MIYSILIALILMGEITMSEFYDLENESIAYNSRMADPNELFSDEFVEEMKFYEGTTEYQKEIGIFKDGVFKSYEDTEGHQTIGFGHSIKSGESDLFFKGLSIEEADSLLKVDLKDALINVHKRHQVETDEVQEVLVDLYFQHGAHTMTTQFSEFVTAMNDLDYERAAANLMYIDPDLPEGKRKFSEYYEKYPDRAVNNINKLLNTRKEVHQYMLENNIIDTMLDLDENPLEIKNRQNYINIINLGL